MYCVAKIHISSTKARTCHNQIVNSSILYFIIKNVHITVIDSIIFFLINPKKVLELKQYFSVVYHFAPDLFDVIYRLINQGRQLFD